VCYPDRDLHSRGNVHLPSHPRWFWPLMSVPFLVWLAFWVIVHKWKVSLKPLIPWLTGGVWFGAVIYFGFGLVEGHKTVRIVSGLIYWTCLNLSLWLKRRYQFETLRAPGTKWCLPWKSATFSLPNDLRIQVREIGSVSPWYVEKLGLRKLSESPNCEVGVATYKFKPDGKSVVLTTQGGFRATKTPILFAQNIRTVKDVLVARGVRPGVTKQDRQGIRYFEIHDPEGNTIEVVENR
jgi:hypothetical protein